MTLWLFLLLCPLFPFLPRRVVHCDFLSLVSDHLEVRDFPPFVLPAAPSGLPHEANEGFLLRPALLDGHVRQICSAVAFRMVREGYPEPVRANVPGHGRRRRLKI